MIHDISRVKQTQRRETREETKETSHLWNIGMSFKGKEEGRLIESKNKKKQERKNCHIDERTKLALGKKIQYFESYFGFEEKFLITMWDQRYYQFWKCLTWFSAQ